MIRAISDGRLVQQPRQPIAAHSVRATFTVVLGGLVLACAAAVVFGSMMFRTSRYWYQGERAMQGEILGAGEWAGWTFLWGLIALGGLLVGAWRIADGRRVIGVIFGLATAGAFLSAAIKANSHWQALLDEGAQPRDYTLSIAVGLPVVTVAASLGVVTTLVLIGFWTWEGLQARRRGV